MGVPHKQLDIQAIQTTWQAFDAKVHLRPVHDEKSYGRMLALMNILLDTCSFLWLVSDSSELSLNARKLFVDPANDVYLSVASVWEIIVKHNLGKLPLPELPHDFIKNNRVSGVILISGEA